LVPFLCEVIVGHCDIGSETESANSRVYSVSGTMLAATWRIRHLVDAAMATRLEHHVDPQSNNFVWYVLISVFLVALAGLMSGLTLGLLSLDEMSLEVLKRSGTEQEQRYAEKIIPVIARPHHLLVTLVLMNAMATEALPIFLDRLINPVTAVIVSIVVVLIFGEVLPQAACTKYGLAVGAHAAWFVKLLMVLTSPIAYPCSLLLDLALGSHRSAIMRRRQLKVLVEVHAADEGLGGNLTADEIFVIQGALDLSRKAAAQACTPLDKTFMLSTDAILDEDTMQTVLSSGHSRIPVYEGKNRGAIVGALFVKELAWLDKSAGIPVATLKLRSIPTLPADMPCYDLLRLFQTGRSHMVFLRKPPADEDGGAAGGQTDVNVHSGGAQGPAGTVAVTIESAAAVGSDGEEDDPEELTDFEKNAAVGDVVGIITIEDVIEELIGEEIVDETDTHVDNDRKQRVNATQQARRLPESLRTALKLDRPKSPKQSFSAQRRRERQSKPPVGITLSRGNSGTGLPDGSHADALLNPTPSLRRASTGRAPIDDRKRLRRSYTDEGMDPHEPLLVGSDYDSDHDSSRADSGRGSHSHGGR